MAAGRNRSHAQARSEQKGGNEATRVFGRNAQRAVIHGPRGERVKSILSLPYKIGPMNGR